MDPIRRLRGVKMEPDGGSVEVIAENFPPEQTENEIWFCRVRFLAALDLEKRIAGVDAAQAIELCEMFLRQMAGYNDIDLESVAPSPS